MWTVFVNVHNTECLEMVEHSALDDYRQILQQSMPTTHSNPSS